MLTVYDIIQRYHDIYGNVTNEISNKVMHKRLKALKESLLDEFDEMISYVNVNIGEGRFLRLKKYPDIYWQLHVHAGRKDIIGMINIARDKLHQ